MIEGVSSATIVAFLVFCRVGGCFMMLPGFASARIPMQVRLLLALAISLALAPMVWDRQYALAPIALAALAKAIATETVIGATFGLVARLYFLAVGFIASAMAMSIGLAGIPSATVEENEPQAVLATMISLAVLTMLFIMDFHHAVLRGLTGSYDLLPIAAAPNMQRLLIDITDTLANAFTIVLRLGSPFIAYAIIANLTIGVLNKLTPQIPVFFVSLPFVIGGGLILLYFAIPSFVSLADDGFAEVFRGVMR